MLWLQVGSHFCDLRTPRPGATVGHTGSICRRPSAARVEVADGAITFHHDLDTVRRDPAHPDVSTVHRIAEVMYERGPGFEERWVLSSGPDDPCAMAERNGADGSVLARIVRIGTVALAVWGGSAPGGARFTDRRRLGTRAGPLPARPGARGRRGATRALVDDGPLPEGWARRAVGADVSGAGVRRVVLLTLGWEDLPKSVSVHGAPPEERLREPVPGVLLQCDGGWLLLDTGFNPALIRDPALRRRFHGDPLFRPVLPGPGEPLEEALAGAGIAMEEIYAVGLSHLHNDHAGGLRHFAGRVPVHAERAELEYGLSDHPDPEHHAMFRIDYDDPSIDWRLAEGDARSRPVSPRCSPPGTRRDIRASSSTSTSRSGAAVSSSPSTPRT